MAPKQPPAEWFVRDGDGTRGPFSEAELRDIVQQSSDPQLRVKQGNSEWHPAAIIRQKMEQLAARGIYIRCGKVAEGPFTITKARELLQSVSSDGIRVRTGERGEWLPASQWLEAIGKLERKQQRKQRRSAPTASTQRPRSEGEIAEAMLVEDDPAEAVLVEAVLVDPDPELETIPVAIAVNPGKGLPQATAAPHAPMPRGPFVSTPVHVPRAPVSRAPVSRAPSHARPHNPRSHSNSGVAGLVWKLAGVGISICVLLGVMGLKFLKVGGKAALRQHQAEQQDASRQPLGPGSGGTVIAGSPSERSRMQARLPSSRSGATAASSPPRPAPDLPVQTGPPTVVAGMLFRPQFVTRDGVVDAGTAFAARIEGQPSTYVISALHLFGPAGGLERDIPAAVLSTRWQGLSLEDCQSHREHSDVEMSPVPLTLAKPLPSPSAHGDVAVCAIQDADRLALQPLPLARETAAAGQRVWLVSEVIGSSSLIHAATIEGTEDGWLLYRFDRSIELRATSGAPVVDDRGQVVAVNAGGGEQGGATYGVGTPTSKFASSLVNGR